MDAIWHLPHVVISAATSGRESGHFAYRVARQPPLPRIPSPGIYYLRPNACPGHCYIGKTGRAPHEPFCTGLTMSGGWGIHQWGLPAIGGFRLPSTQNCPRSPPLVPLEPSDTRCPSHSTSQRRASGLLGDLSQTDKSRTTGGHCSACRSPASGIWRWSLTWSQVEPIPFRRWGPGVEVLSIWSN